MQLALTLLLALAPSPLTQTDGAGPGDAVVVYSAGLEAVLPSAKDAQVAEAIRRLGARLAELAPDPSLAELASLAHEALLRQLCLRVGADASGAPRFQLDVAFADSARARFVAARLASLSEDAGLTFEAPREGAEAFIARTPAGPLSLAPRADGRLVVSLGAAVDEDFLFEDTGLPAHLQPTLYGRYDGVALGELLEPFIAMGGSDALQTWATFQALGLVGPDGLRSTYFTGHASQHGFAVHRREGAADALRARGRFIAAPLDAADLARVPSDATWALVTQLDARRALDLAAALVPGGVAEPLAAVEALTGVDVEADLLAPLGPTFAVFGARSTGGGGLLSTVAVLECADVERVSEAVERVWAFARAQVEPEPRERLRVRAWESQGARCVGLVAPGWPVPFEPCCAVRDGALVLAASPGALLGALEGGGETAGLVAHPRLAGLPGRSLVGLTSFTFLDVPFYAERGYGALALGAGALANAARAQGDGWSGEVLPAPRALLADAQPLIGFERVEGADLVRRTTFDGSWLVRGAALAGSPGGEAYASLVPLAIVSAVAIPNLMHARQVANEAARRR